MSKQKGALSQSTKFELEIEKARNENNWGRLREYVSNLTVKDTKTDNLVKFCLAECELETYLYKNPLQFSSSFESSSSSNTAAAAASSSLGPSSSNQNFLPHIPHKTLDTLFNSEQSFKDIIRKSDNNTICIEASFLLGKLYYAQMRYDEAFKYLNSTLAQPVLTSHLNKLRQNQQAGITDIQQLIPKAETVRQYQIFSEAHSIKGLCLERKRNTNQTSANNKSEEQDVIDSFEIASLLAIYHSIIFYNLLCQPNSLTLYNYNGI